MNGRGMKQNERKKYRRMKGRKRECKKAGTICMINKILPDFVSVGSYTYLI